MVVWPRSRFVSQALLVSALTALGLCPPRAGWAQAAPLGPVIGIEEPSSEDSRTPFEIHTTGVLTPVGVRAGERTAAAEGGPLAEPSARAERRHPPKRIAVVTFCITQFHATYEFAI